VQQNEKHALTFGVENMYLRNSWYVVAWSKEVTDKPFGREVLGERIVVYRMSSGQIGALDDRCLHRHLPLSMGTLAGDFIQCGYPGLQFDRTGTCVRAPSQGTIPPIGPHKVLSRA
jgi:phenylpropionate dioxygenase-like ring-hydroxylating dioxygenase large terminal subunit